MKPMLHGTTWGWGYNIMGKASFKSRRFCFLEDCIGAIPIKNLLFFLKLLCFENYNNFNF
jgi:hypothetical protein